MKWTQIKTVCHPSDVESVCAVMSILDTNLMIEDSSDVIEFNPVYGELIDQKLLERRDEAAVSLFISEDRDADEYRRFIAGRFAALGKNYEIELTEINEEDWADNWKQYYKPVKIGRTLVIVPEWETYIKAEPDEIIIVMDPGMAFGTGTHESTQLCAELLERYMPAGAKTLDIGTGSGILAIAASKLGASVVNAYDIDPMAVRIARENIIKNNCPNITCDESDLLSAVSGLYDFAVANITAEIIMRMAKSAGGIIRRGGMLAISGVIDEQCPDVKLSLLSEGFSLSDELHNNGWSGLLFVYDGKK
ncbi:MAG: 50S ribosomal protein L11 methyltransferase [Eubacteriales bacterium]